MELKAALVAKIDLTLAAWKQRYTKEATLSAYIYIYIYLFISKFGKCIRGRPEDFFPTATTPMYRGGLYSFPWIAPLYPWYVSYIAEC